MDVRFTRRQLLGAGLGAFAASQKLNWSPLQTAWGEARLATPPHQSLCLFTKPFNSLSFDSLADRVAELGFSGIEAPIRKGGHIEPHEVAEKLPLLVEALQRRNLEITVMTSDLSDPNDPQTANILKVAAELGIRRYRMAYSIYDLKRSVTAQLEEWKPQFRDLAALNRAIGIQAVYQNHAGHKHLGAALWDLREVLQGISPEEVGVAYDIRHAAIEGGMSWPITFNMIRPHLAMVYVKDARWEGDKAINVPLGEGIVDPVFFQMLAESGFQGPISLHEEYLDHRQPELVPAHLAAIKRDFQTLNTWLKP